MSDVGDLLAEHAHCHENDIKEYRKVFYELTQQGNVMNQFYYLCRHMGSSLIFEKQFDMTYDALLVMSGVQQQCVESSMEYALKDVAEIMDKHTADDRQVLANEVESFLGKMFDRYDWFVVAFKAKKSSHAIWESRNSHILTKFQHEWRGDVIVSVARQVKGEQPSKENRDKITKAIEECIIKNKNCHEMGRALNECTSKVSLMVKGSANKQIEIQVGKTFTASHAFMWKDNPHQKISGVDEKEAGKEEEDDDGITWYDAQPSFADEPYMFSRDCSTSLTFRNKRQGKFVVMIKSEEEILHVDLCKELNDCGGKERGTCHKLSDVFVAICKCISPYYGERCENDIKKDFEEIAEKHRERA